MNHDGADHRGVADGEAVDEPSAGVLRLEAGQTGRRPKRVGFRRGGGHAVSGRGRARRATQCAKRRSLQETRRGGEHAPSGKCSANSKPGGSQTLHRRQSTGASVHGNGGSKRPIVPSRSPRVEK